ncbi:MAG: sulfatase-like hydrolase/transferase [Anaerolineae bacterium]|nr:sulfatase-like hydrolase/transferase [Anaerolineae bacterium]
MPDKPNIIFIMPDQLRVDFLSCYDAGFIETPHIDSLAEQGVIYGNAYSPHPVCVPARISLITGMDAIKTGVLDNGQTLRPDYGACGIQTWPEILNQAGYYTIATGKMHFYPWEKRLGFQRRIIAEDKLWGYIQDDYYHYLKAAGYDKTLFVDSPDYHRNQMALISPVPWEYTCDYYVGHQSARWIEEYEGDQPFAMMVGFPGPHSPYDPAREFATFDPEKMPEPLAAVPDDTRIMRGKRTRSDSPRRSWYAVRNDSPPTRELYLRQRAYYAGLIKQIDHEVGVILEALRKKGILDNTVIIFSTDHGDYLGDHGLGGKASYYEAACHIPMLVRHPAIQESLACQDLVTLTDVTATILALAGCQVPSYTDAQPLPALGLTLAPPRDRVVGALRNGWMLYDGEWKLVKYAGGGAHLFNLKEDPTEQNNLARDPNYGDVFHRMDGELTAEIMRSMDEALFSRRVYTFSYSSSPDFGRVGWERTYPMPWGQIYPEES